MHILEYQSGMFLFKCLLSPSTGNANKTSVEAFKKQELKVVHKNVSKLKIV